ncbi:MAG: Ig-like domain-containing protein [Micropruina sp.]|uniref:Ig-like domain-containing protein n=1 Tax=Micropruina sp. TaxID=2737536 RepID=UPI0039E37CD2
MTQNLTRQRVGQWSARLAATTAAVALLGGSLLPPQQAVAAEPRPENGEGTLSISKVTVTPGGTITIKGKGFEQRPSGGYLSYKLNDGALKFTTGKPNGTVDDSGTVTTKKKANLPDKSGSFSVKLTIPADLEPNSNAGTYWVRLLAGNDGGSLASKFVHFTVVKFSSKTKASFDAKTKKKSSTGTAKVTVKTPESSKPTGAVSILDGTTTIATGTLASKNKGVIKVKLPKLTKGKHTLTVTYEGTSRVNASSKSYKITVK